MNLNPRRGGKARKGGEPLQSGSGVPPLFLSQTEAGRLRHIWDHFASFVSGVLILGLLAAGWTAQASTGADPSSGASCAQRARIARLRDELENRAGTGRMTGEERRLVALRTAEIQRATQAAKARGTLASETDLQHFPTPTFVLHRPAGVSTALLRGMPIIGRRTAESPEESRADGTPSPAETQAPLQLERRQSKPTAQPVPGRPGIVFSPFAPEEGYVDVRGLTPGMDVRDPFSGRIFVVP